MIPAASPLPSPRHVINPWLVAVAVVIPTFMEVLDTTIANVALRYIAGGLSAPATDSEWVITSYLAANAIVLPISGWLALRIGRRHYFHTLRLNEHLDPLSPEVHRLLERGQAFFLHRNRDALLSRRMTLQALEHLRRRQALSLAYFDVFTVFAALAVLLLCLIPLLRRSVAEKGEHVGAE